MSKNYSILVLSCDKYADLWTPFFSQFHAFWPTCPYPVYLGSNTKKYRRSGIKTILSGPGQDWSSDLLALLSQINEEYIFLWLEDLFPTKTVDSQLFEHSFKFMKKNNVQHIHIAPAIIPDGISEDPLFGFYEKGAPYRVTVPGFWNKHALQQLLVAGENPWKFEIQGSYRSSYSDGYFTLMKPIFEFIRVVDKGKISYEAYQYCKSNHITLDLEHRKSFSTFEKIKSDLLAYMFNLVLAIPWKSRVAFMDAMRRFVVSY